MFDDPDPDGHGDALEQAWDLVAQGDLQGALASAQKSLEANADSPEAHNLIGYVLAAEGQLDAALQHYQAAISIDGGFLEAMLNAADVLVQLGDLPSALELLEDALDVSETDDDVADILLLKVDALLSAGASAEAREVVQHLPIGPFDSPHLDFLVGRARFETGDLEGAAASIEQASHTDRHNPDVFYYLGLLREAAGDVRGATIAFLQCRDLDLASGRPPWAEPIPQFEKRVQAAIRRLPEELSGHLEDALILVDEVPGAEVVSEGVDPRLPLLLDDLPLGAEETLRRAFVYQRNIERLVPSPALVEDEIYLIFRDELERNFT